MSSLIKIFSSATAQTLALEPLSRPPPVKSSERPVQRVWLGAPTWIDNLTVPPWAPEGDPSTATRAREP